MIDSSRKIHGSPGSSGVREPLKAHRHTPSAEDNDSNWAITLSDVMTLLLVFFIVFFVLMKKDGSRRDNAPPGDSTVRATQNASLPVPMEKGSIKSEIEAMIADLRIHDQASVAVKDREVIITLREKLTFDSGRAELLPQSLHILDGIAHTIQRHPGFIVEIDGHTDDRPIHTRLYASNWELSVARATSVLRHFIDSHRIDPSRFYVRGNADQRPLVPNDTAEQRGKNRRVEIRFKESEPL